MIVRDEADKIERCLDSISPAADEIIINDTGSTDGTIEKIQNYKRDIRLIQSKWEDDFSKARNQSLSHASYDWVIWIDADDILPSDQIENLIKLKTAPKDRFFYFRIINIKQGLPIGANWLQARMFPNIPGIEFEYPIHEQISRSCFKTGLTGIELPNIEIHHSGYDNPADLLRKGKRNINLMMKVDGWSKSPFWLNSIADSYSVQKNYSQAAVFYKMVLQCPGADKCDLWSVIHCRIGNQYLYMNKYEEALSWYEKGINVSPENPEQMYHSAKCFEYLGEHEKAIQLFYKVLSFKRYVSTQTMAYDNVMIYAYHYLIRLLISYKRFPEAVKLSDEMANKYNGIRLDDNV